MDESNILLRFKRNAYIVALQEVHQLLGYYTALSSAYFTLPKKHLHKNEVPELLKGYNAMLKHLYLTKYK